MNVFFKNIFIQLKEIFNPATMGTQFAQLFSKLIIGGVVLCAFYFAWLGLRPLLKVVFKRSRMNEMTRTFLEALIKYALLVIGLVTALDSMGIKVGAVLASLGIVGLTIGFAARDSLSNVISGILIFLDRPFVIGDLVEIEGYYGRVDRITVRSTRIVTSDGKMLAVPNTEVINKIVASYTNFPHLRLDIPIAVAVDENIQRARKILLRLVQSKPEYMDDPAPRVVVTALNDYNINIELQVWLKDERQHLEIRFALREEALNAMNEAGVKMPFETFSVNPVELKIS